VIKSDCARKGLEMKTSIERFGGRRGRDGVKTLGAERYAPIVHKNVSRASPALGQHKRQRG
jgi:hypothetical protein